MSCFPQLASFYDHASISLKHNYLLVLKFLILCVPHNIFNHSSIVENIDSSRFCFVKIDASIVILLKNSVFNEHSHT